MVHPESDPITHKCSDNDFDQLILSIYRIRRKFFTQTRYFLMNNRVVFPVILILFLMVAGSFADTGQVVFPPPQGPYSGDYVYITEPGRYTLEQNVSHQYPVGIIIAAPSVILDGQGYSVGPAAAGSPSSVGIWISLTDASGRPVTGVTIRNVSIEGEGYGVYAEGIDSSVFAWGRDRSRDPEALAAASTPRNLILSGLLVSSCREGAVLINQSGAKVTDTTISGSSGSGLTVQGGQVQVQKSHITTNLESGVVVRGSSGSEISASTIEGNGRAGITLEQVSGITVVNNLLDNNRNIDAGADSKGVVLSVPRQDGENIIGGDVLGGNYWASGGSPLPAQAGIADLNNDGIGDSPYDPGIGAVDLLPLVRPLEIRPPATQTAAASQVSTPVPVQTQKSIMSGIHAVITGDTIPADMQAGKTYPVALYLYNDGSDDWIDQYQIGIMALDETAGYGPGWMAAPAAGPVKSGQTQTIQFSFLAPSRPGTYNLKYQAAREGPGVEILFGRAFTKTVTVR